MYHLRFMSPYEMRPYMPFGFWEAKLFPAQRDTFHQECHIPGEHAHRLLSFLVHVHLPRLPAVDAVPVLAGSNWHVRDGKIFVELIKCCRTAVSAHWPHAIQPLTSLFPTCTMSVSTPSAWNTPAISLTATAVFPFTRGLPLIIKTFILSQSSISIYLSFIYLNLKPPCTVSYNMRFHTCK